MNPFRRFTVLTILILSMLALAVPSSAQTVVITGVVQDASGNIYQNGSGRAVLVSGNGSGSQSWTVNGTNPVQSPIVISGLD
jgi:hypothetical protein